MIGFKKHIFRSEDSGPPVVPADPSLSIFTAPSGNFCYREVTLLIGTTNPVKINITGTFQTGGFFASSTELTGPNQKYNNVVDEIISSDTYFNFGILAANSGITPNISSISFTVNDFTTGDVLQSYFLTVNHALSPC